MANYVLEASVTGEEEEKKSHSSTKHRKFLGVSGKEERVGGPESFID